MEWVDAAPFWLRILVFLVGVPLIVGVGLFVIVAVADPES